MNLPTLRALLCLCVTLPAACAVAEPASAPTLSWSEVEAQPLPPPGERIAYGSAPEQFGELRLPTGKGPFASVILIHGGCWLSDFDYVHITRLAAALVGAGYAVWTIEYRRLGSEGGGWPGTFTDAADAADELRKLAQTYPLDLTRVVAVGHSAGGQLALWLAARAHLPKDSPLYRAAPLPLRGVIGLAAITDLASYRIGPAESCHGAVEPLLGGTPAQVPTRYAQTSPLALLPLGVPQWLLQGQRDSVVEPAAATNYAVAAKAAGDQVTLMPLPDGHFEMVLPRGAAYAALRKALAGLLQP